MSTSTPITPQTPQTPSETFVHVPDVTMTDSEKPVKVQKQKPHRHYNDPRAEIAILTNDGYVFKIHLHFLKQRSAFFADMAEMAVDDNPEPMDVDLDSTAFEKYAEYVYSMAKYPSHVQNITGKGDPDKMFRALAVFEKLQDDKLVERIKEDINKEYKVKNSEKAAAFMCLALGTGRTAWAQEMMRHMDQVEAKSGKPAAFDIAKFKMSVETVNSISQYHLLRIITQISTYNPRRSGKGLWASVADSFDRKTTWKEVKPAAPVEPDVVII